MTTKSAKPRPRIPILGIIGGIASGKSFVANEFARQDCAIIDADKIGHEVLSDPSFQKKLFSEFGTAIAGPDGTIDRRKLAGLVFGEDVTAIQNRRRLESLVHPEIRRRAEQQIGELASPPLPCPSDPSQPSPTPPFTTPPSRTASSSTPPSPTPPAIIVDAPLLIEAGWETLCDYILFIDTDPQTRMHRAAQRGWNEQQWKAREASQASIDTKRRAATHIISGDQSPEQLRLRVRELLQELQSAQS